jgi:hypothetical protein
MAMPGQQGPQEPDADALAFEYHTRDSVTLQVYECLDPAGLLNGYTAHVATPVCEDRLCYDAELDMYWDVLGNFARFAVDLDKPLTKEDHVPFEPSDYTKLKEILLTKRPSFIHLRREELITKPAYADTTSADALTGATAKEVKKDMVAGAVFTCYTLWHIANGGISFEIGQHTSSKLDERLIRKLLDAQRAEAHYFLVENIGKQYFAPFLHDFLELAERYDAFFTDRLLDNLPVHLLEEKRVQDFFIHQFNRMEHASQEALLVRLEYDSIPLHDPTLEFLIGLVRTNNLARNDHIIRLVCNSANADDAEVLEKLVDRLLDRRIVLSAEAFAAMTSNTKAYPALRKKVKQLGRIDGSYAE